MKLFLYIILITSTIQTKKPQPPRSLSPEPNTPTTEDTLDQTTLECNQTMMISYGLTGYSKPQTMTHKYCPLITHNCCTPQDETLTMELWNSQSRYLIEKYYETYLYSVKYILGFSQEGMDLARDYENDSNLTCRDSAADFLDMNMNLKVTEDIYKAFVISLEKMGEVRRGFYCVLCDARTQTRLKDFWSSTNLFYKDRMYYSKDFCRKLVENTIRSSYFTVFYLKRYAENLATLINCRTKKTEELVYEIPYWTKHQVKNCYYFKDKYFFFFCERYCQKFHLTKANSIFDGDLTELKKFVDLIIETRHEAFDDPSNNILMNGLTYEEDILKYNYEDVFKNDVFFKSSTNRVQLEKFKTDIVYWGGMDPWESCENSLYQLVLAKSSILKIVIVGVLLWIS